MELSLQFRIVSSIVVLALVGFFVHLYNKVWLKSERLRRKLQMQGIKGPSPSLLYGNLAEMQKIIHLQAQKSPNHAEFVAHDYTASLFPYFEHWRKEYGLIYTYSTGMRQHLYVNQPELVKEMNQCISLDLGKPSYVSKRLAPMLGNGILRSNGIVWSQQRKILAPELYADKVKPMVALMLESAQALLSKWEEYLEGQGGMEAEIEVDEDLKTFSADVISRACFGSSYSKGKEIFSKLRSLQDIMSHQPFLFGSFKNFEGLKKQKEMSCLEKEVESLIWEAVKERKRESTKETSSPENDLLQKLLLGAMNEQTIGKGKDSSKQFIVDNCKNIYFAGHESTAVAASWCLMLLALHPEWQAQIRTELAQVCPDGQLDANSFPQLKMLNMVIQEVMRLYPPAAFVSREVLQDTQVGNFSVPKGVCLWTLIPTLHRDTEIWGQDANEFKPERFIDGVSKACKYPQAYIPFGLGPRICLGRSFAMIELKVVLALIISKFTFSLSSKYKHSPAYKMIVGPGNGVQILIQKCHM